MSTEPTFNSSCTQPDEQTIGGSTNTVALLEACVLNADHGALQEHLENNKTEQSMLDRCLMLGLQIVLRKEKKMGRVAPALQLLWQYGAKWNPGSLLEYQMTPLHLICLCTGDHHELLDLSIQSSEPTLLHAKDCYQCTALMYAVRIANTNCVRSLIAHGAEVNINTTIAQYGRVDLPKCLLDRGIDKDVTDEDEDGRNLLCLVTEHGKVDTNMNVPEACHELCKQCGVNMLVIDDYKQEDPCLEAVCRDMLDVVQLFDKHGSKSVKYFSAIRLAVIRDSVKVLEYLHKKYKHPLNMNYSVSVRYCDCMHWTLLKEACHHGSIEVGEYLLEHGADLNERHTVDICSSVLLVTIQSTNVEIIALLIRNGVDVNFRSYDYRWGYMLPFEAAVQHDYEYRCASDICIVEMLLVIGCNCGVYSLDEDYPFKDKPGHYETKNLMMKWNVQENNVKPLKQQCRRMILKHLSPRASKMIEKLPLPQCLIKYLSIPELDDFVAKFKPMHKSSIPTPYSYINNSNGQIIEYS